MFLTRTTAKEIKEIIELLKHSTSVGSDEITVKILEECSQELSYPLKLLINNCKEQGETPQSLKISKIIPKFKNGDPNDKNNYRSISILSTISKIEKLFWFA